MKPTPQPAQALPGRDHPLRICLLSYRSNPHSGGQGVYVRNLGRALQELGHRVEVISGPPASSVFDGLPVVRLPGLDLYDPENLFRMPELRELADPVNLLEWTGVSSMGFPEPLTFGIRACGYLLGRLDRYDIVHDNQSLSYGLYALSRKIPAVATIHHPITVDRKIALANARGPWQKLKQWRWFSFLGMQRRVARTLGRIVTVSAAAKKDIQREFGIDGCRIAVVPNGIDTGLFRPLPGIERDPWGLIVTNSADSPLKGLGHLLRALAQLARSRPVRLTVVGEPKSGGSVERLVGALGLGDRVSFTGRIDGAELVRRYARASVAVVPSLYEGFGLPAGEAMACAVPVVSTTGGALPEVVGDAGLLVPPASPEALSRAIAGLLDDPGRARSMGMAGYGRVRRLFTWRAAAEKTVEVYREAIGSRGKDLRPSGPRRGGAPGFWRSS